MGKIFFTGDLHFGHANVIAFDNRPFKTVEEMDAELIRRWNNKVGKGGLTYVLGDMIWKARNDDAPELIKSLKENSFVCEQCLAPQLRLEQAKSDID